MFLVSFMGNQGTFTRGYRAVILDMLFLYHVTYVIVCMLGLFIHEFFYSFLVRNLDLWALGQNLNLPRRVGVTPK